MGMEDTEEELLEEAKLSRATQFNLQGLAAGEPSGVDLERDPRSRGQLQAAATDEDERLEERGTSSDTAIPYLGLG